MTSQFAIRYVQIILISVLGSFLLTFITCPDCLDDTRRYLLVAVFSSLLWILLWIGNALLSDFISAKISWVENPVKRLTVGLMSMVVLTVGVTYLVSRAWELIAHFEFGGYYPVMASSLIVTLLISFFLHGREFLLQWKDSLVKAEKLQRENAVSRFESLKNQVNPHFLFNSLNVLSNLVYDSPDQAMKFIKQLSQVYRYVLDTREREVVPIGEELHFLDAYLFLQQIRFGDKLRVENIISDESSMVAPLALQILVENAIKHNEISLEHPLLIHLYRFEELLVVENSLRRKKLPAGHYQGVGIDNIRKRYQFLTNKEVVVNETENIFRVSLPRIPISS